MSPVSARPVMVSLGISLGKRLGACCTMASTSSAGIATMPTALISSENTRKHIVTNGEPTSPLAGE